MDTKKHPFNWLFWMEAGAFILIALYFTGAFFNRISGGFYMAFPWGDLFQALYMLVGAGLFAARNRIGWYLAAGYFWCLPITGLSFQIWSLIHYGISDSTRLFLLNATMVQLLLAVAVTFLLCLPRVRVEAFGIRPRRIIPAIAISVVVAAAVVMLVPWWIGRI